MDHRSDRASASRCLILFERLHHATSTNKLYSSPSQFGHHLEENPTEAVAHQALISSKIAVTKKSVPKIFSDNAMALITITPGTSDLVAA